MILLSSGNETMRSGAVELTTLPTGIGGGRAAVCALSGFVCAAVLAVSAPALAQTPAREELRTRITRLVQDLGNEAWTRREWASSELVRIGSPARDALIAAMSSDDMEVADRSRIILRQLRWNVDDEDSPLVSAMLANFHQLSDDRRVAVVAQIGAFDPKECLSALLRIASYDLSEMVALAAASAVTNLKGDELPDRVLSSDLPQTRPALLMLLSWAQAKKNPAETVALLEKAIEAEQSRLSGLMQLPSYDPAYYCAMIVELEARSKDAGRKKDTAKLWEHLVKPLPRHMDGMLNLVEAVLKNDHPEVILAAYNDNSSPPPQDARLLYYKAMAYRKLGKKDLEMETAKEALDLSGEFQERHLIVGDYLMKQQMDDFAEKEFQTVLTVGQRGIAHDANAYFRLVTINYRRGDLLQSADYLDKALDVVANLGPVRLSNNTPEGLRARAMGIRAEHYKKVENVEKWTETIRKLTTMVPTDTSSVNDFCEWLRQQGRPQDAVACVESVLQAYTKALRKDPAAPLMEQLKEDSAPLMDQLAWVLARNRQRLDEARQFADKAVALAANNPGYLGTLAEVLFQQGDNDTALEKIQRALALKPGDRVLQEQLKRFLEAKAAKQE